MKKVMALMLSAVLILGMAGCSGGDKKADSASDTATTAAAKTESGSKKNFTEYDDLQSWVDIIDRDVSISTPAWREDSVVNGYVLTDTKEYSIIVTYNIDEPYTGDLENILDDTHDEFTKAISKHAYGDEYDKYNLTTKEKVTLDCGAQAIKFEGTVAAEESDSKIVDYYIYGYSFVHDNATITVGASIFNPDYMNKKADLKDKVDRMVKTIRPREKYLQ